MAKKSKLLTQPATLELTKKQKMMMFWGWIRKSVQGKIMENAFRFMPSSLRTASFFVNGETFNQTESMSFW